jgi:hypothetical protein
MQEIVRELLAKLPDADFDRFHRRHFPYTLCTQLCGNLDGSRSAPVAVILRTVALALSEQKGCQSPTNERGIVSVRLQVKATDLPQERRKRLKTQGHGLADTIFRTRHQCWLSLDAAPPRTDEAVLVVLASAAELKPLDW